MAPKPNTPHRISEESELETLSPVNSYPDCSPPSYFKEEEEELEAGPSDSLFPSTFDESDDTPQDGDGDAFTQKWQPGFMYKKQHAVLTRSEERDVYGTNNARYSKDEDSLYQLLTPTSGPSTAHRYNIKRQSYCRRLESHRLRLED